MTILHRIGNFFRELLMQIPLSGVRAAILVVLILLWIWVLRLPRSDTAPPHRQSRWDENLKLWASIALVIQILIYSFV